MPRPSDLPMEPGRRDRVVTLQQKEKSKGPSSRFPIETWTTLEARQPAQQIDLTAGERMAANQLSARYDARWQIGYRADMDPDLVDVTDLRRIVYLNRVHDIVGGVVIGLHDGLEFQTLSNPAEAAS